MKPDGTCEDDQIVVENLIIDLNSIAARCRSDTSIVAVRPVVEHRICLEDFRADDGNFVIVLKRAMQTGRKEKCNIAGARQVLQQRWQELQTARRSRKIGDNKK